MKRCWKARTSRALAVTVLALLLVPVSAWAARSFAPGIWQGRGRVTGGFSGSGVSVHVTRGAFAFCLYVARNGAVTRKSKWVLRRLTISEHISSSGHTVTGTGVAHGAGLLKGHASSVKLKGAESMSITITVGGHQVTTPVSYSVSTPLSISRASLRQVTGDVALKARAAQQQAGFTSDERALYVAHPVSHCTL